MIEQVELLDKMATEAGNEKRKRISDDLHDTTLQTYIALKLGLDALLQKIEPEWHLRHEMEKLSAPQKQCEAYSNINISESKLFY